MTLVTSILLLSGLTGTVDVGARMEVRLRDSNEPVGAVVDLETIPDVALRLRGPRWDLDLEYTPRFTLRQAAPGPVLPEMAQAGTLGLRRRFRHAELSAREDLTYGTQSFTSLVFDATGAPGAPPIDLLPPTATIRYVSSRTDVGLKIAATRRWTFTVHAGYALSGGADAESSALVPFQTGPFGSLAAEVALTRKDRMVSTLAFEKATFSLGPDDTLADASLTWRHLLARGTESTLSAGVAGVFERLGPGDPETALYPVAEAAIGHGLGARGLEGRLALQLGPVVSWLTGLVDERLQVIATGSWRPAPKTTLRAQIGVGQSLSTTPDGAATVVFTEAAASRQATRWVRVEVGARGAWQAQGGAEIPPEWVLFVGAAFAAPTLRF